MFYICKLIFSLLQAIETVPLADVFCHLNITTLNMSNTQIKNLLSSEDLETQELEAKRFLGFINTNATTLFTSQDDLRSNITQFFISQVQHTEVRFSTILDGKTCSCPEPDHLTDETRVSVLCPIFRYMQQLGLYHVIQWKKDLFSRPKALLTNAFENWFPNDKEKEVQYTQEMKNVQRSLTRTSSTLDKIAQKHSQQNRCTLLDTISRRNNIASRQQAEHAGSHAHTHEFFDVLILDVGLLPCYFVLTYRSC